MRDELRNRICEALRRLGIEADWNDVTNELVMILDDYEITHAERALVVRDDAVNERLLKNFLATKAVEGCTKRTVDQYHRSIKFILNKIGKNAMDITTDDIRIYLALRQTQDKISKSYANTELRYLSTFFNHLMNEEVIARDPTKKINSIKVEKKQKKAFSGMELEKLRGGCQNNRQRAIIEMLLSTGCRVSELVGIKIEEINGEEIIVHGKGEKDRTVYLNAKAQYAIEAYLNERKDKNPYLFPRSSNFDNNKKGRHTLDWYKYANEVSPTGHNDKGAIESFVRKLGKRVGVDNVHPHRFRRTCATMALSRGMPLLQVSKMLGHEQVNTTQIYLDIQQEEVAAAHKKYVV